MHACYFSGKRGDLVNVSERLALCLVLLALVPVELRHKRTVRLNALAREAKRGAGKYLEDKKVRHIFFRALSAGNMPPEVNGIPPLARSGCSGPGQDKMQGGARQQAACALCTAYALIRPSRSPSPCKRKQNPTDMSHEISDNEPGPFSSSHSYNSGSAASSLDTPKELSPLDSWASLGTQQGVHDEVDSHAGKVPCSPDGKNSSGMAQGAPPPSLLCSDAKSGPLSVVNQLRSSRSSSRDTSMCPGIYISADVDSVGKPGGPCVSGNPLEKGTGREEAGTNHKGQQRTPKKRKAGPVGEDGLACKVPRRSESEQVGGLIVTSFGSEGATLEQLRGLLLAVVPHSMVCCGCASAGQKDLLGDVLRPGQQCHMRRPGSHPGSWDRCYLQLPSGLQPLPDLIQGMWSRGELAPALGILIGLVWTSVSAPNVIVSSLCRSMQ
jgi:hypothetical protein